MVALFVMLVKFMLWASTATVAIAQAKPGCPDRCGDVGIPYPFGLSSDCFLNETYAINCSDSFTPPKPFTGNIGVKKISVLDHDMTVDVLPFIARDCYFTKGRRENNIPSVDSALFTISDTKNKFMAVGCDTYALINIYKRGSQNAYMTGCMSICNSISEVQNNSCSGIGCCQVSIPKGMKNYSLTLSSYYRHANISDFNNCSYAFVVENTFNFSSIYLQNFQDKISELPLVLDWAVGNETCEVAETNKSSFLCRENSECDKSYEGPSGYRCKCLDGYQGNPYLDDGCTDINECDDPDLNQCVKPVFCENQTGNYTCSCPEGYFGDGKNPVKGGTGCTRFPKKIKVVQVAVGVVICSLALVAGISWLYLINKKRKLIKLKEKFFKQNGGFLLQQELAAREVSSDTAKIFTAEELEKATDNYDESRIVGRGGFGTVYKGILADNTIVAIKKSKLVDESQIEQFINEVIVLSKINHRNVVKLLGCCLETEVPLLVYEFVTNGTLFDHIHDKGKAPRLPWGIRLRIAAETAGVLSYLHSSASTPIIHRDVKPTNILLDDNYTAKVSDFGTSRLVPVDQTELSTMVQGTLGYLDPEYLHTSQLTEKSDVYSFGVVLVELFTGKKALAFDRPEEERSLAMHFLYFMKKDRLFDILESDMVKGENREQLMKVAELAKNCLKVRGEERPTMKEVARELEGLMLTQKHPWIEFEQISEETEYLLNETETSAADRSYGSSSNNNTSSGYDSIRSHVVMLPIDDGR